MRAGRRAETFWNLPGRRTGSCPPGGGCEIITAMTAKLRALRADIMTLSVDAIVNAANR